MAIFREPWLIILIVVLVLLLFAAPKLPAFARRSVILLGPAAGAALPTAVRLLVYRRPGASFRFLVVDAAALIAFLDVFGLALLLVRVTRFVSPGHRVLLRW